MTSVSRVLETFLDLVRISSPTGRERGVAEYAAHALRQAGCDVRFDDTMAQTGADTGNLIATIPGDSGSRVVAFSAHMDCVSPCEGVEPMIDGGFVRSAGDTVLGGDDKIGIAAIIEAARRLADSDEPHAEVRVLLSVSEEEGLLGAKAMSAEDARADLCLVLDADGPVGGIVTAAPTQYVFKATFRGRAAHAGVEPEKGASAIRMAAAAIARMELGRLDERTTANIGTIEGGSATNVVAPLCVVTGECRSLDSDRVERVREEMEAALREGAASFGGTVDVVWELAYGGFSVPEESAAIAVVRRACADIGVETHCFPTGGGSDANILTALGIETVALACGMSRVHTTDEEVEIVQLERLADLLVAVARRALE